MRSKWLVLGTGFALFSMFFGSGNLVFPIAVGKESEGHYLLASLGIVLTGVVVPFLGVFGMLLYKGEIKHFFSCFGKKGIFVFSLFALALMGPFGVLARCLTVAHGALLLLLPNLSLPVTSLCLCGVIFAFTVKKSKIIPVLGTILTPFLLVSIVMIAVFGVGQGDVTPAATAGAWKALVNGFFQGYQTMDLLAAFFFSGFVIKHLHEQCSEEKHQSMLGVFSKASFVGAGLLAAVYCSLVLLGWMYAPILADQPPQEMLGIIAIASLGNLAAPCVCLAVVFACLTTAIVLASLFADFLRHEVAKDKIGNATALFLTLTIGFLVSTLDFAGIARFLGPVLEAVYPALIVLTVVNIALKWKGKEASTHWPFTLTLAIKLCLF